MIKQILFVLVTVLITGGAGPAFAQETSDIVLYNGHPPGPLGDAPKDIPFLRYYPSMGDRRSGSAVVIFPGGGYQHLAPHEGDDYAEFLRDRGITCFVLTYRLGADGYRHPAMLQDAARAMRIVRSSSGRFRIDPNRIGVMGSSAGGHLASTLITHFDAGDPNSADPVERVSSRPDFAILCYPVITMGQFAHAGSKKMLLGENPSPELVAELSNELHVSPQTPPCFIWHGLDDKTVPVENALMFADALKRNGVPFDLHIYQQARHGLGLGDRTPPFEHALPWTADLMGWLKLIKVVGSHEPASRPASPLSPR